MVLGGVKSSLWASQGTLNVSLDDLVDAIYIAEGSEASSVPYGLIYNRWCVAEGACRYVAKYTVEKHLTRCWKGEDAVECVGRQYAPVNNKHGHYNRHWIGNVRAVLNQIKGGV